MAISLLFSLVVRFEVGVFITQVFELFAHCLCPCLAFALEAHELYVTKADVVVEYVTSWHDVFLSTNDD
jgi:hypothetical protein